jgi:hypothetical protein
VACVAVAAVGLISLAGAGTATAASPEWLIEGSELSTIIPNEASIKGVVEPIEPEEEVIEEFLLTTTILNVAVAIECAEANTGKIVVGGKGEQTLTFSECGVLAPAGCGTEKEFTMAAKTQLVKIGGRMYNVFEPKVAGGSLGTFKLLACAIAGNYAVKGKTCSEGGLAGEEGKFERSVFSEAVENVCKGAGAIAGLTVGVKAAHLSGVNLEWLTGAYLNQKWGEQ